MARESRQDTEVQIIMLRTVVTSLLFAMSSAFAQNVNSLDPTQVYTTANIVNNTMSPTNTTGTWQNLGLVNQGLPCWAPGGPVYCGPQPYFNNGSFNFSYGITDVHQIVNIANALPNSGTGLRVNGYNFTFFAKNGNGWDNGQQDYLSAYVNFFGKDGKSVRYDYYDLNYKFDWTLFGWSKTFDTPFASKDLSTVQYGFVGGDSNFWAGPYGPEVQNVGFSLKYSVDPCFVNVLSSPTCPGYLEALAKLNPQPTVTTVDPISSTATSPGVTTTTAVTADPTNPTVTVTSTPTQPTTQTTTSATQVATTTSSSSSSSSSGTSIGLSVIAKNKEREQALITQTVQNALSTAASAANESQKEALAVASQSSQNSQTFASTPRTTENKDSNNLQNSTAVVNSASTTNNVMNLFVGPQTQTNNISNQQNQSTVTTNIVNVTRPPQITQTQEVNNSISTNTFSLLPESRPTTTGIQSIQNAEENKTSYSLYKPNIISATNEVQSFVTQNFLTDRTNPLNEIIENRIIMPETNVARTGPSVNRNVANNELAGNVDINRMALAPTGYGDYLNFTLRDGAFYEPKEIYKNQKNVDNARALRQLSSDRLHQEMVEQQYRR